VSKSKSKSKSLGPAAQKGAFAVDIDASAFDAAAEALGANWDAEASKMVEAAMQRSAEVEQRAIRKQAARHRRTGRMESQIKVVHPTGQGFGQTVTVRAGGSVAHFIAAGTRFHEVQTLNARHPLRLFGFSAKPFAQHAQHRAVVGDPFFERGVRNARLAVNNVLQAALRDLAAHLADILKGAA
jgi:hypothetical protein